MKVQKVIEDVDQALRYTARKTNYILKENHVPQNSGKYEDYEYGKSLLLQYGMYDNTAIRILAAWVGV